MEMVGSAGSAGTYFKTVQSDKKSQNKMFCGAPSDGTSDSTFSAAFGFTMRSGQMINWE